MEIAAVSAAVRGTDGRDRHVPDTAVRRERLCGRNAHRDGSDPRGAVFRVCGAVPAADRPDDPAYAPEPFDAYGDRNTPRFAYIPAGRIDRQRQSSQRTDHRTSGRADRPRGRPSASAGTVCEAVRQRRSVRRAPAIGHVARVRKRDGRLHLRAVAGTDRKSAGDRTGMSFAV